jgi:hypothetical protein
MVVNDIKYMTKKLLNNTHISLNSKGPHEANIEHLDLDWRN